MPRVDAPADPIARFQHHRLQSGELQIARRRQPGNSSADDDHVHTQHMPDSVAAGKRAPRIVCWHLGRPMRFVLAFFLAACAPGRAAQPERKIALSPCRLKGSAYPAQCGTLRVPENRSQPGKRQIDLKIAIIPALARSPATGGRH